MEAGDGFDHGIGLLPNPSSLHIFGGSKADTTARQMVGSKFRQNFDNIPPEA